MIRRFEHEHPAHQPADRPDRGSTPRRALIGLMLTILAVTFFAPAPRARAADEPKKPAASDRVIVDDATEKLLEGGLRFLASRQAENGSWSLRDNGEQPTATTAYVIHAFMACGHLPGQGPYGEQLQRGVNYLVTSIDERGLYLGGNSGHYMYGHGIATIVLGEVLGESDDPQLRAAAQRVVDTIIASQNREGGWRYQPSPADADISVTVLQLVALRVARNSGIAVPQESIDRAVEYVKSCQSGNQGGFSYMQHGGGGVGFARTAAAIYSLQVCGLYDDPLIPPAVEYLKNTRDNHDQWWAYGHFYAMPALYMVGGKDWDEWYPAVRNKIVDAALIEGEFTRWQQGTFNSHHNYSDILLTASFVSTLAIPYGYLPIYQR
jgi:hypothetical protein